MPATKAPSTVLTPIACVVSAIAIMITRIAVMTANSLSKLSFTQRIRLNTTRRPTVKLTSHEQSRADDAATDRPDIDGAR